MKRTFNFGKIDYYNNGRKINSVDVTIELRDTSKGPEFSASGTIWNAKHTDCVCGGQCLDTINDTIIGNDSTFKTIFRLWKLYHLNGMYSGTEEQESCIQEARLSGEYEQIFDELDKIEKQKFPLTGGHVYSYEVECEILKRHNLYEVVYQDKPYKYGHGWLYRAIPDDDLKLINKLIRGE